MSAPLPADLHRVDPADAWRPWQPDARQPFDPKWAAHLFRRAAFGASPDEIQSAVRDGLDKTLDRLFAGDPKAESRAGLLADTGDTLAREEGPDPARGWWLYAMLHGGHPLREKLTLFWHNHFATSVAKVRSPLLMFRQNQLLRAHALGKFGPLLAAVSRDPAMLVWLDSNENVKRHPNENFAREVMELFTLGVGNYSEKDVREAARAFTGWHVNGNGDAFERNAAEHDDGPKTVLGRTGNWDGDDVLNILLERPACARFLAAKLYRYFVSETDPPAGLLEPIAEQLRRSQFDVGVVVQTVLRSRLFFSEHAYAKRIKSPVEYVLGAVRAAWPGPHSTGDLTDPLSAMGQALFAPPNVKGWVGGKAWLTDATLLARHNFAERVCVGPPPPPVVPDAKPMYTDEPDGEDVAEFGPPVPEDGATDRRTPAFGGFEGYSSEPTEKAARLLDEAEATRMSRLGTAMLAGAPVIGAAAQVSAGPVVSPANDPAWYVRKLKARTPADVVRAIGEQFLPGDLPVRAAAKLESFLGKEPVPDQRVREAIHAVLCLPEYQLC